MVEKKSGYVSGRGRRVERGTGVWVGVVALGAAAALVGALTVGAGGAQAEPPSGRIGKAGTAGRAAPSGAVGELGTSRALGALGQSGAAGGSRAAVGPGGSALVRVAGVRPGWATAGDVVGVPAASAVMTTRVFLAGADPVGLAAYARAVSTAGGAGYRQFLSGAEAAARFGPAAGEVGAVSSWLSRAGLRVTDVDGEYLEGVGTVGEMEAAYGVTLRTYSEGGDVAVAPEADPAVPAGVAPDIAAITGLTSVSQRMYAEHVTAASAARDLRWGQGAPTGPLIPSPCSAYYGQAIDSTDPAFEGVREPYTVCGYSAGQLREAYGATGHEGDGATVAIVDAYGSSTMQSDANEWSAANGLPEFASGQYTEHVTPAAWNSQSACGGAAGWASEEALDVEAVHAMAPGAHVLYYGANSCQDSDLLAALSDLITHHLAQVISDSWGGPLHSTSGDEAPATIAEYEHLFQLAAVEGITVNFSSGDCGDNSPATNCGGASGIQSSYAQTTFPASDGWVTAVGGTSTAIGRDGRMQWATSWGTQAWVLNGAGNGWTSAGWIFGGGGGTSADFAQPWYQAEMVPTGLANTLLTGAAASSARRVVPDISLDADPFTGLLVGATQPLPDGKVGYAEAAIGGTSLASPLLSGLEADSIAMRDGLSLGFVNPTLYGDGMIGGPDTIRDVTDTPSNARQPIAEVFPPFQGQSAAVAGLGSDGDLHAGAGYDDATGLGTPGRWFIDSLAAQ